MYLLIISFRLSFQILLGIHASWLMEFLFTVEVLIGQDSPSNFQIQVVDLMYEYGGALSSVLLLPQVSIIRI